MVRFDPVEHQSDYDDLMYLMRKDSSSYMNDTLNKIESSWEKLYAMVQSVGTVYRVIKDEQITGYLWIEERGRVVHIHGLVMKDAYKSKGIATEALTYLEHTYRETKDALELGVHESNIPAKSLYEKLGYETVRRIDQIGFLIMQLNLTTA